MQFFRSRKASAVAIVAALSMVASPAFARGHYRWRDRDRVDAGDIFAGLLVIGGIAAIASAASKNKQQRSEPDYRYPQEGDYRRDGDREPGAAYGEGGDNRPDYSARAGTQLGGAVEVCTAEMQRRGRSVAGVDSVRREGDGWHVEGSIAGGRDFSCSLDRDGGVRDLRVGDAAI